MLENPEVGRRSAIRVEDRRARPGRLSIFYLLYLMVKTVKNMNLRPRRAGPDLEITKIVDRRLTWIGDRPGTSVHIFTMYL